jgi:hypothetical protein
MPLSVIVNDRGTPEPPTDVVRRLRAVDPKLTLRWGPWGAWQLVREWRSGDRRWERVQTERYDPEMAFDVIGHIPNDCSAEQVPALAERCIREWANADEAKRMLDSWDHYHTGAATTDVQEVVEEAIEATVAEVAAPLVKKGRRKRVTLSE